MRTIRFHGNQDEGLDEVPVAEVGPDQVKIVAEWCGLCAVEICAGGDFFKCRFARTSRRAFVHLNYLHPITKENLPRIFGHEFASVSQRKRLSLGTVLEIGKNVTNIIPGDKVAMYSLCTAEHVLVVFLGIPISVKISDSTRFQDRVVD